MSYFLLIAAVAGLMIAVKLAKFFGTLFMLAVIVIAIMLKSRR